MDHKHTTEKSRKALPAFAADVLRVAATVRPRVQLKDEESNMKNLIYSLRQICRHNRDGSFKTQSDRERMLILIGKQLDEMGFKMDTAGSLKTKHVDALVKRWTEEKLGSGSIKNRMSALRWLAAKINKQNIVARGNDTYGIADRRHVTNEDKGRTLSEGDVATVTCPYTQVSLRLQAEFGLRREESIKFQPSWADRGDRLVLKPSWTKGGRMREIPIRTEAQRALVDEARALAATTREGSLIARETYVAQLQVFKHHCDKAGIHHVHGHRHRYAQRRYWELTGRACPSAGGPSSLRLTGEAKARDREARLIISAELGHAREQVTAVYLGR
jgi:site-specific recombinase XerC